MRGDRGFTLVEAMVAMTIFSFVAVLVAVLYLHGNQNYSRESEKIEVQENLRIASARMVSKIRQAKPDTVKITNSDIEFTLSSSGEETGYRLDVAGKEIEEKNNNTWLPIASNITALDFKYDPVTKVVSITVTGEKRSGSITLTTDVYLRVGESG